MSVDDTEAISINSPPPRPTPSDEPEIKEVQIPVPTPTPVNEGKKESDVSTNLNVNETETSSEANEVPEESSTTVTSANNTGKITDEEEQMEENVQTESNVASNLDVEDSDNKSDDANEHDDISQENSELFADQPLEQSQLSFENIQSKMGDEDVIVDPIKLLEGEGESLKNSDENGRDYYDEGFHSGGLVNSEEDSNSIETLGSSGRKEEEEEDVPKPTRVATPMPRSNSFYKPVGVDPESKPALKHV